MIRTSETIIEIAKALNKFQSGVTGVKKGTKNTFFNSNYATLGAIQKAIQEPLEQTGLCYIQSKQMVDGERVLTTRIMHITGEWIESDVDYIKDKDTAQGAGSASSYAKRYGLTQAFGIPTEDDDGNAASQPWASVAPAKKQNNASMRCKVEYKISKPQQKRLFAIASKQQDSTGWFPDKIAEYIKREYKIESTGDLNRTQYDKLINLIETKNWEDTHEANK